MPRTDDHYAIKLHNDGTYSPLVASWIQSIYDERDEAIARNRELEAENEALEAQIDTMQELFRGVLGFLPYDAPTLKRNREQWRAECDVLVERIRTLLGESK